MKKCGGATHKYTTDEWINLANAKPNVDNYDYSQVNYVNARTKITIICNQHGEFEQTPSEHLRERNGSYGCIKCREDAREPIIKIISLEKSFAKHKKAKYWSEKNELQPKDVAGSSNKKYYFDCKCGHEIYITLGSVQNGSWCGYCSIPSRLLCSDDDCVACYDKSFASCEKKIHWSDENIVTPRQVFKSSHSKYLFKCDDCNHIFENSPNVISRGHWCNYCENKILCSDDNCKICFKKSFASSNKVIIWSPKNNILPRSVFKSSTKSYLFDCNICKHIFTSRLDNMTSSKKDCPCPYCNNDLLCDKLSCISCFYKSFLACEKSVYWSKKNNITPRFVFKFSQVKYIFNCKFCEYEYVASLNHVTTGKWCNCRKNKTETKLRNWLNKNNFIVTPNQSYDWCKNEGTNRYLPFDFVIESLKIIIELDGPQHFKQVSNWKSFEETIKLDVYKMNQAIKNGYTVIRLLQEDVWNNKNNWSDKLTKCIDTHTINNKSYYFLCMNNEYENHEKLLLECSIDAKEDTKTASKKSIKIKVTKSAAAAVAKK